MNENVKGRMYVSRNITSEIYITQHENRVSKISLLGSSCINDVKDKYVIGVTFLLKSCTKIIISKFYFKNECLK
jgi:hypothetical protein